MSMYLQNVNEKAKQSDNFREVLGSSDKTQVVIMSLLPGEDIGVETHPDNDQVLFCVDGTGKCVLDGKEYPFETGDAVIVSAGTEHNFINGQAGTMKIVTTYSPPHHADGTIHKTKAEAEEAEAHEHDH